MQSLADNAALIPRAIEPAEYERRRQLALLRVNSTSGPSDSVQPLRPLPPSPPTEVHQIVVRVSLLQRKSERTRIQFTESFETFSMPPNGSFESDLFL